MSFICVDSRALPAGDHSGPGCCAYHWGAAENAVEHVPFRWFPAPYVRAPFCEKGGYERAGGGGVGAIGVGVGGEPRLDGHVERGARG
eukprot:120110-Rhodomonas_salina.1